MSSTWIEQSQQGAGGLPLAPKAGWFGKRVHWTDAAFLLALLLAAGYSTQQYSAFMDVYELGILWCVVPVVAYMGYRWAPMKALCTVVALLSLAGISSYGGQLAAADTKFVLKYMLSSQSAILWMSVFFSLSTLFYTLNLFFRSQNMGSTGSKFCWAAVYIGLTGMLVRWYESYLIAPDVGHIPLSNLYEVFIVFCLITALMYLYYEQRYATKQLGGFVLLIVSFGVGFILWYTFSRHANGIQPLVPALQSYWMKIHVPANFVGYGAFSLAAMVASAYLLSEKGVLTSRLPPLDVLDDLMYKAISVGFAFFTIATILGAVWAAEAWGGYWSWDAKETWALIVWLNYAAWLHLRLVKGLRGPMLAWWALIGLLVTTFAFLGVNMFLSGLHSYGTL